MGLKIISLIMGFQLWNNSGKQQGSLFSFKFFPEVFFGSLIDEYDGLFEKVKDDQIDTLRDLLVSNADWSDQAASYLLQLVKDNGSFILRNALSISLALGIEDGELGF